MMKLQIKVNLDTGVIEDAKFKTFGCGPAIASSSLATEWLKGKSVDDALKIKNTDIVNELKLPPVKIHCSVLAEDAIKAAIRDFQEKRPSSRWSRPRPTSSGEQGRTDDHGGLDDACSSEPGQGDHGGAEARRRVPPDGREGGGCSGMTYDLQFDNELRKHDKQFEVDGVKVVVDVKSSYLERDDAGLRHTGL